MDDKIKHLEFIQAVINRFATESARIKSYSIILTSVLLFLFTTITIKREYMYIPLITIIAFWILDSYYLWQERLFRALYDYVRLLTESDFSMDVSQFFRGKIKNTRLNAMFSETLTIFYGLIALVTNIVFIIFINSSSN